MAFEALEDTLLGLKRSLVGKAEQAYEERDAATEDSKAAYAQGEAHAYAVALAEIRDAEMGTLGARLESDWGAAPGRTYDGDRSPPVLPERPPAVRAPGTAAGIRVGSASCS